MQVEKGTLLSIRFPEYYLLWTFDSPEFLIKQLKTWDKLPLEFYDKGIPNHDNGPDYRQALIKIGNTLMRGDIEFHHEWQDWFRHGHDGDQRYNQVILHILWYPPKDLPEDLARRFPHFILSEHVNMPYHRWREAMEILKNQELPKPVMVPKLGTVGLDPRKLAWKRFIRKSQELRAWVIQFGWETTLFMGLAKVLGYNKNSHPFVQLIKSLPPSKIVSLLPSLQRSPLVFWVLLAWQAGLLERPLKQVSRTAVPDYRKFINHLKRQFSHVFALPRQDLIQWNFSRLRPYNNPYNRLAGFSQIIFKYHNRSLFNILLDIHSNRMGWMQLLEEVKKIICIPLSSDFKPFFQQLFGSGILAGHSMGFQRSQLFHLNVLLPIFYVWAGVNHSPGFARYLEDIYFQFPAVDSNSRLQSLIRDIDPSGLKNAFVHQALLEYYQLNFTRQQLTIQKMH